MQSLVVTVRISQNVYVSRHLLIVVGVLYEVLLHIYFYCIFFSDFFTRYFYFLFAAAIVC